MSDYISRQAAIEVIDAVFPVDPMKSEYVQGIACGAALAKTYVEQLPSAQPQDIARDIATIIENEKDMRVVLKQPRWIPCSERLPQENETVLISAKYIGHLSQNYPYVEEGFLTHDGWYSAYGDNYSELLAKVVAWMPLPEPYKGEES